MKYYSSPAKINRMLKVVRREANGYHYLQTIFQFTTLNDQIGFKKRAHGGLIFHYPHDNFSLDEDLIYRAIVLLEKESGQTFHLEIDLIKNLPMGGGVGGGSSNAGTTLLVLNHLYDLELSTEKLIELGAKLGADVPIFIYGKSAWAEGIGEKLQPISLPEEEMLLIVPNIPISTRKVFESEHLSRHNQRLEGIYFDQSRKINDCESAIFHHYPKMKRYMEQLTAMNTDPFITGTGASIYIAKPDADTLTKIKALASENDWTLHPFNAINQSPLLDELN